jgi:hypothetical protein
MNDVAVSAPGVVLAALKITDFAMRFPIAAVSAFERPSG